MRMKWKWLPIFFGFSVLGSLIFLINVASIYDGVALAGPDVRLDPAQYEKPDQQTILEMLTPLQYQVTQEDGTEPPFYNAYWDMDEQGLYVDIVTGEPLFSSRDKFLSLSGWPSFSKPIVPEVVVYKEDHSHGMIRIEVRSRVGDSHLGHVFEDGPSECGLRYCINSAALRFIPLKAMEGEGYGSLIPLVVAP